MKEEQKMIDLIEELKKSVGDNERIHGVYDAILTEIAKKHEPELLKEIDEITKDASFWFA